MATDHALKLGKLVGNLQSLEAVLRVYLLKIGEKPRPAKQQSHSYWDLVVGDVINADEFSNYDTLGTLVRKFNDDVRPRDTSLCVDPAVVDVRDLLAHGRVAGSADDTATLMIVKFDKPSAGTVTVVASALNGRRLVCRERRIIL
ncbi:MAG: hypothetical protein Q8Q85_07070 [Gemmatimonadales bacterium]|nr:hypothetical protein [Gemmatimonadales bacterium]